MPISVQSPTAALIALDALANAQTNPPSAGNDPAGVLGDPPSNAGSDILDVNAPSALGTLNASLAQAASIADAGASAGAQIAALLKAMREAAVSASNPSLGADQRSRLDKSFRDHLAGIDPLVAQAGVGGVNLLDGSAAGDFATGDGGSGSATLTGFDLTSAGPLIGLSADASLTDAGTAGALADQLGGAIDRVQAAVGRITNQGAAIQGHLGVLAQASFAASPGGAQGLDSTLDQDGARLQALLIQQQLGQTGAGLANQAPQSILALFR